VAVTQPPPGLDQGRPCLGPADGVDPQSPLFLEPPDRRRRRLPEPAGLVTGDVVAEGGKPPLEVVDLLPVAADGERQAVQACFGNPSGPYR